MASQVALGPPEEQPGLFDARVRSSLSVEVSGVVPISLSFTGVEAELKSGRKILQGLSGIVAPCVSMGIEDGVEGGC